MECTLPAAGSVIQIEPFDEVVFRYLCRLQQEAPFLGDRYEPYLLELADALEAEAGDDIPPTLIDSEHVDSWLGRLCPTERHVAESMVDHLSAFLASSRWVTQPSNDPEKAD